MTSVLIVEDEESLADPLAFLLRKEGFEATVVTDGPAALAEFDRAGADIVLLDLMLPGCRVPMYASSCALGPAFR